MEAYVGQQFVGIDLHRRRSVIMRTTATGELLESVRILNSADRLAEVMTRAGQSPEVVLEATYGWYWAVDALQATGSRRPRCGNCGSWCATAPSWLPCAATARPRSTRSWPSAACRC